MTPVFLIPLLFQLEKFGNFYFNQWLVFKGVEKAGVASYRVSESKCYWDKRLSCNNLTMLLSVCHPSCFSRQPFLMSTQPVNLSVTWCVAIYTHTNMCSCILYYSIYCQVYLSTPYGVYEMLKLCSSSDLHKVRNIK